jgi:DNA-binding response OmpR family regulator
MYSWIVSLTAVAFLGFVGFKYSLKEKASKKELPTGNAITIGKFLFYDDRKILIYEFESIPLSDKETRLLKIFASRPNQTISRDQLMKEVWEDEGVIVGRSLDVFVSKLRKKLSKDSNVKLTNVHGLGYKLEIY